MRAFAVKRAGFRLCAGGVEVAVEGEAAARRRVRPNQLAVTVRMAGVFTFLTD